MGTLDAGTVVITGATGSLGYRAAARIAASRQGWFVVVTGREPARAAQAAARLSEETGAEVVGLPLDLASLADVRRFAEALTSGPYPPLRAVVCNAGIQIVRGPSRTVDGFETTFAVNHLGHFLLTRLLVPSMVRSGRIVFVASDTHDPARRTGITMPAPRYTDARSLARPVEADDEPAAVAGRRRYTTSKLCAVLTAYEFARRIQRTSMTQLCVNAFDPGLMPGTGLARDYGGAAAFAWRHVLPVLTAVPFLNIHTPRRSGAALARLVTDPGLAGVT
ncbi:MAG: SDR family NAD(P)-dependent oxidoreductase, partial [Kutzneria sp.]|nr:SDR family NAD(P)-dependent oxidoreductase [Kutzneria sp.]